MSSFGEVLKNAKTKRPHPSGTPKPITILQAINNFDPTRNLKKQDMCSLNCKEVTTPCSCSWLDFFTKQKWFTKEATDAIFYNMIEKVEVEKLQTTLQEFLDADKQNYEVAKAIPQDTRDKAELLAYSWGRIQLAKRLLGCVEAEKNLLGKASPKKESEKQK